MFIANYAYYGYLLYTLLSSHIKSVLISEISVTTVNVSSPVLRFTLVLLGVNLMSK